MVTASIDTLTILNINAQGISDLTGIEDFTALTFLHCTVNQLTCLNVKNGNNLNFIYFTSGNNPNLTCIEVDDATYSTTNWTDIDAQASFSTNCNNPCSIATGIEESSLSKLSLYPNPTTGIININLNNIENASVKVLNNYGQVVYVDSKINTSVYQFELAADAGIYIVVVNSKEHQQRPQYRMQLLR